MANHIPQGKNEYSLPTWPRCGKKHYGRCLFGSDGCYMCGEISHMITDLPKAKANVREVKQVAKNSDEVFPKAKGRF